MTEHHTRAEYMFAPIPEALLFDSAVSHLEVRIYAVLIRHGLDPSSCYPSHSRIADLANCSKRSVAAPLRNLETAGWISRQRRYSEAGEPLSNGYTVHTFAGTPERGDHADKSGGVRADKSGGPRSTARIKRATQRDTDTQLPSVEETTPQRAQGNRAASTLNADENARAVRDIRTDRLAS